MVNTLATPRTKVLEAVEADGRGLTALRHRPGTVAREQVLMSSTGLYIPKNLSFTDWEHAGSQLSGILDSSCWWLGDWLVFGKRQYVDGYPTAIRAAGLRYQTLRNYAWVARRFELGRRRPKLRFQHHAEVASLPIADQECWLDQAEEFAWTTKLLRTAIRGDQVRAQQLSAASSRIEIPSNKLGHWRMAADSSGVELKKWMASILDQAAHEVLDQDPGVLGLTRRSLVPGRGHCPGNGTGPPSFRHPVCPLDTIGP